MKWFKQELIDIFGEQYCYEIDSVIETVITDEVDTNMNVTESWEVFDNIVKSMNGHWRLKNRKKQEIINVLLKEHLTEYDDEGYRTREFSVKDRKEFREKLHWIHKKEIKSHIEDTFRRVRYHRMYMQWHEFATCPFNQANWMAAHVFEYVWDRYSKLSLLKRVKIRISRIVD